MNAATGTAATAAASDQAAAGDASHLARSGLVQLLAAIAQSLMLVTQIAAARLFGPVKFGTYQTCVAVVEMLARAGMAGADKGMLRYVAGFRARQQEQDVDRALGTGLRLAWRLGGGLMVAAITVAVLRGKGASAVDVGSLLPYMAPAVPLIGTTIILVQASLAVRSPHANLVVRGLAEPVLLLAAVVLAWVVGGGLRALGVAYSVAAALTTAVAVFVVGRVFGHGRLVRTVKAPRLPGFAAFSIPLGAAEILNAILQRADLVILTYYVGGEAAAFYVAAEFIARVIANVRYAFDSVAAAVLSEALHTGDQARLRYNLALMTRWVITCTLPVAIVVVALRRDLLTMYGAPFAQAAPVLVILAAAQSLSGCLGLAPWTLMVAGRSRTILLANLLGAVLNVSLGLLLISRWGLLGAATAALGTVVGFQSLLLVATWRAERVHPFDGAQLKPLVAAGVTVFAQPWLPRPDRLAGRVAVTVLATVVVYLAVLLLLRLPPEERRLFERLRRRRS